MPTPGPGSPDGRPARPGPEPRAVVAVRPLRAGVGRMARPGRSRADHRTRLAVVVHRGGCPGPERTGEDRPRGHHEPYPPTRARRTTAQEARGGPRPRDPEADHGPGTQGPRARKPRGGTRTRDTHRAVKRGWQPGEFSRVGPGKNARVGQNETRPPPRMRWRGPCTATVPGVPVARRTLHCRPPASASHPQRIPVSRSLPRPGVSSE